MNVMRAGFFGLIGAAILALIVSSARAQQPTPSEIMDALNLKANQTQETLDRSYLAQAQLRKALADAERNAAWVLDNWVPKQP